VMREKTVTLDFVCRGCEHPVGVTVQCRGMELRDCLPEAAADDPTWTSASVAQVLVPCPTCGQINQLLFEPTGRVRAVRPMTCYRPSLTPSVN
jgi:hypothetical protein